MDDADILIRLKQLEQLSSQLWLETLTLCETGHALCAVVERLRTAEVLSLYQRPLDEPASTHATSIEP